MPLVSKIFSGVMGQNNGHQSGRIEDWLFHGGPETTAWRGQPSDLETNSWKRERR